MADDEVQVFAMEGPNLPPAMKLDNKEGVVAHLVSPAYVATMKLLLPEIGVEEVEKVHVHVLQEHEHRLFWRKLKAEQPPPKVANQIHVFFVGSSDDFQRRKKKKLDDDPRQNMKNSDDFQRRKKKKLDDDPRQNMKNSGDASLQTQPLQPLIGETDLFFEGRAALMQELAERIDTYYNSFCSSALSKDEMLFIVLQGLAGVGKTRCLLEIANQVVKCIKQDSALHTLYIRGAVQNVYFTFNGPGYLGRGLQFLHHDFIRISHHSGCLQAGRSFMKACVVSEIMYGRPYGELPCELQEKINQASTKSILQDMYAHVRKQNLPDGQPLALYLLVDDSHNVAQSVEALGGNGVEFLEGMFSWIGHSMTCGARLSYGKSCNLCFIPVLAGTELPLAGGRWGIFNWLKVSRTLAPLDLAAAVNVLKQSLQDHHFPEVQGQLEILLEDCSCLPRLILYIYRGWQEVKGTNMPAQELVQHLRSSVFMMTKEWVNTIIRANQQALVRRMVLLCLSGAVMEERLDSEVLACQQGYVYAEKVPGGWRYHSPRLLVRSIAESINVPARSVPLISKPAKGDDLEYAFLDILHALLLIYEDKCIPLKKLFVGATGRDELLEMKFKISSGVHEVEDRHQFYIPRENRFYYQGDEFMVGQNGRSYFFPPCKQYNPSLAVLFKCQKNAAATDVRVFLLNTKDEVYEIWIQLKGQDHPMGKEDVEKYCKAAFDRKFDVDGRIKIYVLCNTHGFSFNNVPEVTPENVLLLNLVHFMPEFVRQSPQC